MDKELQMRMYIDGILISMTSCTIPETYINKDPNLDTLQYAINQKLISFFKSDYDSFAIYIMTVKDLYKNCDDYVLYMYFKSDALLDDWFTLYKINQSSLCTEIINTLNKAFNIVIKSENNKEIECSPKII